jgi:hypothetical protein
VNAARSSFPRASSFQNNFDHLCLHIMRQRSYWYYRAHQRLF